MVVCKYSACVLYVTKKLNVTAKNKQRLRGLYCFILLPFDYFSFFSFDSSVFCFVIQIELIVLNSIFAALLFRRCCVGHVYFHLKFAMNFPKNASLNRGAQHRWKSCIVLMVAQKRFAEIWWEAKNWEWSDCTNVSVISSKMCCVYIKCILAHRISKSKLRWFVAIIFIICNLCILMCDKFEWVNAYLCVNR